MLEEPFLVMAGLKTADTILKLNRDKIYGGSVFDTGFYVSR